MKRIAVVLAILAAATACKPTPPAVPPRHTLTCLFATPEEKRIQDDIAPWVEIRINREGGITWNGTPVNQPQLEEYLSDAGKYDPQPFVIIGAKEAAMAYGSIAPLMRLAYVKKAYRLGLATSYPPLKTANPGRSHPSSADCWMGPQQPPAPKTQDEIEITTDNGLHWNGQTISHDDLVKHLEHAGRATPQPLIFLKIAPEARFSTVADLMYYIDAIGPQHLRLEVD